MKKIILIFLILITIISCIKDEPVTEENNNLFSQNALVVGYLPSWRFDLNEKIEYCKITHLNLAFANPDSKVNLIMPEILA